MCTCCATFFDWNGAREPIEPVNFSVQKQKTFPNCLLLYYTLNRVCDCVSWHCWSECDKKKFSYSHRVTLFSDMQWHGYLFLLVVIFNDDRVKCGGCSNSSGFFRANDTFVVGFITVAHFSHHLSLSLPFFLPSNNFFHCQLVQPFYDTSHSSHMLKFMTSFRSHEIKSLGFIFPSTFFSSHFFSILWFSLPFLFHLFPLSASYSFFCSFFYSIPFCHSLPCRLFLHCCFAFDITHPFSFFWHFALSIFWYESSLLLPFISKTFTWHSVSDARIPIFWFGFSEGI